MSDEIGDAIRQAAQSVQAPQSLRESVSTPRRHRVRWTFTLVGGVIAAALIVVVLSLGGGPSVQEVAQAALQAPTQPAPAGNGQYVDAEIGGIRFPDYAAKWDWQTVGARRDTVDGRDALTVIYEKDGVGVHYTVVDGDALARPEGSKVVDVDGTPVAVTQVGDTLTASWKVNGHTCILASKTADEEQLLHLVDWA